MTRPKLKLAALLAPLFCAYAFHCTEARAASPSAHSCQISKTSPAKASPGHYPAACPPAFPAAAAPGIPQSILVLPRAIVTLPALSYLIRTGLSPPRLLV